MRKNDWITLQTAIPAWVKKGLGRLSNFKRPVCTEM
jgi:hypothetical protein